MHQAEVIALLLMVVITFVVIAQKFAVPYPVLLVLSGLGLSFIPHLPVVKLNPDLVFFFVLPALIYPVALTTSWRDFRRNLRPILLLAIGLVLFTTFAVGWMAHAFVPGLPWAAAFALGAIVSPPDAVAATAVLERLSVPRRTVAILEGESLVNDATALVALQFAVAALMTGTFSPTHASIKFLWVATGGIGFGLLVGFAVRWVHRHLDNPPVQITISLLTPFAAYLPAERLHLSGVLATVAAGIFLGWHSPLVVRARMRLQAQAFWEVVVFLLNGLVFVVIGLQLPSILRSLSDAPFLQLAQQALAVSGTVVLVRIAWVFPAAYLPRLLSRRIREREPFPPWQNVAIVAWSGMRGVVSLAAAFALPLALNPSTPFPGRSYILFLTFSVILTTLVFQGLTLPLLIRTLGVKDDGITDEEERLARLEANKAAIEFIERAALDCGISDEIVNRLRVEYADRLEQLKLCCESLGDRSGGIATFDYQKLQQRALDEERRTIIRLRNEQTINDDALRRIQRDLDLAEARLTG
jgi:CPA1 family monovalent cation:H+ antiporter